MGQLDHPACPHCAYDLSGVAAAWADSCPLDGLCSECGGSIVWGDVFSPHDRGPAWLFETRRGLAPVAVWRTWLRALYPPAFWRAVRLEHRPRPARLALWLLTILAAAYLARAALYAAVAWWTFQKYPAMRGNWDDLTWYGYALSWPFFSFRVAYGWKDLYWLVPRWPLYIWATLAISAAFGLGALAVVPVMARRAGAAARPRVSAGHVLRAWVYSHAWLGVLAAIVIADLVISLLLMAVGAQIGESTATGYYHHRTLAAYWLLRAWPAAPVVALAAWQAWWWNRAIVVGWRMPRAGAVWAILLVFSLAAAGAAAWTARVLRPPEFQW